MALSYHVCNLRKRRKSRYEEETKERRRNYCERKAFNIRIIKAFEDFSGGSLCTQTPALLIKSQPRKGKLYTLGYLIPSASFTILWFFTATVLQFELLQNFQFTSLFTQRKVVRQLKRRNKNENRRPSLKSQLLFYANIYFNSYQATGLNTNSFSNIGLTI